MDNEDNELETEDEIEENSLKEAKYKIHYYGADFTLGILSKKLDETEIKVPQFQRKFVWPASKQSKLIESFLLKLPVPQIFLYREKDKQDLLIVDGQQRLKTINNFFKGLNEDGSAFRLVGVREEWEGKEFKELEETDKRLLKNTVLRTIIFEQIEPENNYSSMFEIFTRLNTGGVNLGAQEIRNCIYFGEIVKFLDSLNQFEPWRDIINKQTPDKRMKDIEMIVKFFALLENWENYTKSMSDFIGDWMKKYKDIDEAKKTELKTIFEKTINFVHQNIGNKAFRSKSFAPINTSIFDSVCVAINLVNLNISEFSKKYNELINKESYKANIFKSTSDVLKVKGRIKIALQQFS